MNFTELLVNVTEFFNLDDMDHGMILRNVFTVSITTLYS